MTIEPTNETYKAPTNPYKRRKTAIKQVNVNIDECPICKSIVIGKVCMNKQCNSNRLKSNTSNPDTED